MPPTSLQDFVAGWELFADPTLAGTIAGAILGFVGVYVVLRRMVFLSAAMSQAAGLGVVITFYVQSHFGLTSSLVSPTIGAMLVAALLLVPIMSDRDGRTDRRDSLLGLGYLVGGAGTLVIGTRVVQELHDIDTILLGSAVAVLPEDFRLVAWMGALVLALHIWWWRGFTAVSFDRTGAFVRGMPVRILEVTLLVSIAAAIAVSTRVLGALPTFGFSVLPAMAAVRIAKNVQVSLLLAALIGAACGFAGYVAAFLWDLPVGAAQTLCGALMVGAAEITHRALMLRRRTAA